MPSSAAAGGLGRIGGAGHAPARGLEVSEAAWAAWAAWPMVLAVLSHKQLGLVVPQGSHCESCG